MFIALCLQATRKLPRSMRASLQHAWELPEDAWKRGRQQHAWSMLDMFAEARKLATACMEAARKMPRNQKQLANGSVLGSCQGDWNIGKTKRAGFLEIAASMESSLQQAGAP